MEKNRRFLHMGILIFANAILGHHVQAQHSPVNTFEPGVSESLAKHRAHVLSNIGYKLKLNIPALQSAPVIASETISFHLSQNQYDLQVDFKEQRDHIKRITVNRRAIAIVFKAEHIIISKSFLKIGTNDIAI